MQAPRHLPLIVLLLVAAGAAGFGVYQWLEPTSGPMPANGEPVAGPPPMVEKPMSPQQALAAKYEDLHDGSSRALGDWHGKVVLVNFWATWCAPCREEIPLLVHLQAKYAAQGLQVVGIATDEVQQKDVKAFLDKLVVNYPMLMGDDSVDRMVAGFGGNLIGLPFTLVLSRDGQVLDRHPGELDPQEADRMVQAALKGVPAPAEATTEEPKVAKAGN